MSLALRLGDADGLAGLLHAPARRFARAPESVLPAQLEAALQTKPRIFLFNNPNNPTGAVYDQSSMDAVARVLVVAPRFLGHRLHEAGAAVKDMGAGALMLAHVAAGRYDDAYLVNWESNVFPGILGRTCDRPCEPACRRGRVDGKPVAILGASPGITGTARGQSQLRQAFDSAAADRSCQLFTVIGAPGVGKTSLGQSVAKALGRKFARISLGVAVGCASR